MSTDKENQSLEVVNTVDEMTDDVGLITTLTAKQQRFIHLYLTGQYTITKLSQLMQVHPNTLHNWMRDETVKTVIRDMQSDTTDIVSAQLKSLTLKAVTKLSELVNSPIDGVALQAVKDILDRSGHKAKQEIKIDKTVRTFEEKLTEIMDRTIIDAEFEVQEDE